MVAIKSHEELEVFQRSIDCAVRVFQTCRSLPDFERFRLVDQWLRCSRSVPANLAEAWRKRYYRPHFLSKLSDAEAEAAECQVWALLAVRYGYITEKEGNALKDDYEELIRMIVGMVTTATKWVLPRSK
jgi:four helix bundle protein